MSLWDSYPYGASWYSWRPGYDWDKVTINNTTVIYLIISASTFGDLKRLTCCYSLILAVSQSLSIKCPFKLLSLLKRATFKGKNMLSIGSVFFSLIVAIFKTLFSLLQNIHYRSKVGFNDTDINILRMCVHKTELQTVFHGLIFCEFCFYLQQRQIKYPPNKSILRQHGQKYSVYKLYIID